VEGEDEEERGNFEVTLLAEISLKKGVLATFLVVVDALVVAGVLVVVDALVVAGVLVVVDVLENATQIQGCYEGIAALSLNSKFPMERVVEVEHQRVFQYYTKRQMMLEAKEEV
jgi:hypothetical protein